jgi:hypothetical protein
LSITFFIVIGICIAVGGWQLAVWQSEISQKNRQCQAAVEFSQKKNKPMLVAGGPWGGRAYRRKFKLPAHNIGDVAIDITSSALTGHPNGIVANVTHLPFPDKTFGAAFASHLLEHLPDTASAKQALAELSRVSEGVFIAYPSRQSLAAWLIRDHHLWVWQKNKTAYLKQRGGNGNQKQEEYYQLNNG